MSACVCVHESQSPLRASRQQTHCGIWCFLRIDSRPAPAAFPLAGSTACLRLWMLSEVKAVATCACFFLDSVAPKKINLQLSHSPTVWLAGDCLLSKATVFLSDTNMQNPVLVTCDKPVALATFIYSLIWCTVAISETWVKQKHQITWQLCLSESERGQLANWGVPISDQMNESTSRVSGK